MPHEADITQLLLNWSGGDREALDRLIPLVYTQSIIGAGRRPISAAVSSSA